MKAGLLWAGAILCAVPLLAHHSAAAEYDLSRTVRISGAIAKVEFSNLHVTFSLDVMNPDGTMTSWNVETAAPTALMRGGLTRDLLARGTTIAVEAYLAKDGSPKAAARTVTLADGREFALRDPAKFDGCTEIAVSPGNCIRVEPVPEK
jgi:Family of unknown function (DUF6152)